MMVEQGSTPGEHLGHRVSKIVESLSLVYQAQHTPPPAQREIEERAAESLLVIERTFSVASLALALNLSAATRYMLPQDRTELFDELRYSLGRGPGVLALEYMHYNLAAMTVMGAAVNGLRRQVPQEPTFAVRLAEERELLGDHVPEDRIRGRVIARHIKEHVGRAQETGPEPLHLAWALLGPVREV